MNKKAVLAIIVLLLAVSGSVFAQNAQELRVGAFLQGNLNSGQEIWYSVRATEAGVLTVETTGETDTYLEAYDSGRNLISENDDYGDNINARLNLIATAGITYLIKLRGYDEDSVGAFRIFASHKTITELRVGVSYNGNIVSNENYWFTVRASQNSRLVTETSSDIDTILEAYDKNFNLISDDDDSGENLNALLVIDGSAGETYFFMLKSYGSDKGPYQILVTAAPYPAPTQLNIGSFHSGNISAGGDYWFSVQTARKGNLSVGTTGSTDTYLYAYTGNYELIAQNDDGDDLNAFITIPVAANSTYIFRLKGYSADTTGSYRLFVSFE